MMKKIGIRTIISLAVITLVSSCTNGKVNNISGAGATFPEPYYKMVFKTYDQKNGTTISYGAIGSGGGYRSLKDHTVDFGASDVFLTDEEMKQLSGEVVHIPTTMGGVVLSYNLPGVNKLKMDSQIIAGIFIGEIKKWNDEKIKAINEGVELPDLGITPVYRSDGSGSTAVFSQYMCSVSDLWKDKIGQGKSLNFPVGISAKGNAGVAGMIASTNGAVGYIGSEYALAMNLKMASLKNKAGNFIDVTEQSISAAADTDIPNDTRCYITNSANPNAYPISTMTWIIVYKDQKYDGRSIEKAKALKSVLTYILSNEAQNMASHTNYAPLPKSALDKARKALDAINYGGQKL